MHARNPIGFTSIEYSVAGFFLFKVFKGARARWLALPKGMQEEFEKKLIDEYLEKYLDSPPLNIRIHRPKF